jgi:hypothetical protein
MGALRKRLGAVRPEKGKVMGEARRETSVLGRRYGDGLLLGVTLCESLLVALALRP